MSEKINLPGYGNTLTRGKIEEGKQVSQKHKEQVDALINNSKNLAEILMKHNFIKVAEGLIFADFSGFTFIRPGSGNEGLASFFRELFSSDYYIKGFFQNVKILNDIYDKQIKKTDKILLGEEFMKINSSEEFEEEKKDENKEETILDIENKEEEKKDTYDMYYEPNIADNLSQSVYPFPPKVEYNPDKFIASLYKNGLRYGFDVDAILSGIAHSSSGIRTNKNLVIARQKDPINGTDAFIEIISLKVQEDLRSKDVALKGVNTKSRVDLYSYANATFDVKEGEVLLEKIKATPGKIGRDVIGKKINPKAGEDNIKLAEIIGEGLEIKEIEEVIGGKKDTKVIITASISGTLQKDPHTGKYVVSDGYHIKRVDIKTGNINIHGEDKMCIIDTDVAEGRTIKGDFEKLEISGNLYGTIEVTGNTEVIIKGNMAGRSRLFHKGTGRIEVGGIVSNLAALDAKEANVHITKLLNGNVYVNSITLGEFLNGNIIAKKVNIGDLRVSEKARVNIVGEQIDIQNLNSPGTFRLFLASSPVDHSNLAFFEANKLSKIESLKTLLLKIPSIKFSDFESKNIGEELSILLNTEKEKLYRYQKLLLLPESKMQEAHKKVIDSLVPENLRRLPLSSKIQSGQKIVDNVLKTLKKQEDEIKYILLELDNINKAIEKAKDVDNDPYFLIHSYTPESVIELYNYFYPTNSDTFHSIPKMEYDAFIKGTKLLNRERFSLSLAPYKYVPHKRD